MNKIGIIYSFNTTNSKLVAQKIKAQFKDSEIDEINTETITGEQLSKYQYLIAGSPTWFDGELPNYWDEFMPELKDLDLKGKKIALFGLGNQVEYPENFLDAIGILAEVFEKQGATIIGHYPVKGFKFESSIAVINDKFVGLPVDLENMADILDKQIETWTKDLKKHFK